MACGSEAEAVEEAEAAPQPLEATRLPTPTVREPAAAGLHAAPLQEGDKARDRAAVQRPERHAVDKARVQRPERHAGAEDAAAACS
jgi:hypothetical protein